MNWRIGMHVQNDNGLAAARPQLLICAPDESSDFPGGVSQGASSSIPHAPAVSSSPVSKHDSSSHDSIRAVLWQGDHLRLLDQRRLPFEETYIDCRSAGDVAAAIRDLAVRGAPAIGIAAA